MNAVSSNANNQGNADSVGLGTLDSGDLPQGDPIRASMRKAVRDVREQKPLAQSFTNFVTINLVANAQLAVGGSAAMSFLYGDIIAAANASNASYINVGTLLPFYGDELRRITETFHKMGQRWVLDPVAAGLGDLRTSILAGFRDVPPVVVRGNASEIIALEGMWGLTPDGDETQTHGLGVEAGDEVEAASGASVRLARFMAAHVSGGKAAVAVSGAVDLVTDGNRIFRLPGGSEMMTRITGAGCSLGGVTATYLSVADPLIAALTASALYNRASEAAADISQGPGTFQQHFLDALWVMTADEVADSRIVLQS